MTTAITAIVEAGLLRPTTPLHLADGTRVEVIIVSNGKPAPPTGRVAKNILTEIAALPTSGGDPRTSEDHDRVLYDEQERR
jgi:predicted DNA-binding antitoxin AbrB/MazE fold protein